VDRLRIGAVSYLNTKPLIYELERLAPDAELVLDLPSRLADRLRDGTLDVALIPIVEYCRANSYRLVPGIRIASQGPVLSVTIFSRTPWEQIRRIALDEGSRTSAALSQVILRHRYGIRPELRSLPMDAQPESMDVDAVLLIGDRAMRACLPGFPYAFDLGQEWHDWTGLPFVYAAWAVRNGVDLGPVELALHESKRLGQANTGPIAAAESKILGLDAGFCRRYLTNIIRYDLGPRELAGLHKFASLARDLELVPRDVRIEFYESQVAA
jgi:chorismate dehydratase